MTIRITPAVKEAVRLVLTGKLNLSEAAKTTGTALSSVRRALRRLGHDKRPAGRPTDLF